MNNQKCAVAELVRRAEDNHLRLNCLCLASVRSARTIDEDTEQSALLVKQRSHCGDISP